MELAVLLMGLVWSSVAAAQASSWLYVGGGAGVIDEGERETRSAISLDTGLGTSAKHTLVAGGVLRVQGYLGAGADVGIAGRLVTSSFVRGGFGAGIDAGVYQRLWGSDSTGFIGNLVLGAPWGITLIGGASVGSSDQRTIFASLGIDLSRLTVHRSYGLDWFANPMRSPDD